MMTVSNRSRNGALLRFIALPMIFLTVALLGGLRVSAEDYVFVFVAPPLITLVLAVLLMLLFVRGHAIELGRWVASEHPTLVNVSHLLTLLSLFFASAQAFNSVLPERGLLHWLFSFFFLWTLWNNQFSSFDARRSSQLAFCRTRSPPAMRLQASTAGRWMAERLAVALPQASRSARWLQPLACHRTSLSSRCALRQGALLIRPPRIGSGRNPALVRITGDSHPVASLRAEALLRRISIPV